MWGLDIAAQVRILFGADLFQFFFLYRQHIICALTPHVLTSLHIVLGTQGQVHALDTSGAYLGKPCFAMLQETYTFLLPYEQGVKGLSATFSSKSL